MTFDISKDSLVIWSNVAIALLFVPAYMYLGETFKYFVSPYIIYMVWSKDPRYFPALIIHIIPGSTISSLILLTCLIMVISKMGSVYQYRLRGLFLLAILPALIFIGQIFIKIFYLNNTFIEIVSSLSFYLGLFPFFYGVIVSKKVNNQIWESILIVLFLLTIMMFLPNTQIKFRGYWFSFPLFVVIFVSIINGQFRNGLNNSILLISLLFILLIIILKEIELKFTLIFSATVSITILFFYYFRIKILLSWLTKLRLIVLGILVTILIIISSSSYNGKYRNYEELSLFDMESPLEYFIYKALGDRGVLWRGGWDFMVQEKLIWPPNEVPDYSFVNSSGVNIEGVNFGMHNLGLELMRNYGFVVGGIIILVYVLMITRSGRVFSLNYQNVYVLIFAATVLGTGIVGGLVGQFPLMSTFSFLLMGIAGMIYGKSFDSD